MTGAPHLLETCAIDGCSIPTHAVPLKNLALGFARMATGSGLEPQRAKAASRLLTACMNEPFYVDGTGQPCRELLKAGQGQVFAKNGAEGVYCGAIPALDLGIAVKIDDGALRAAASVFAAIVSNLLGGETEMGCRFAAIAKSPLLNRNSIEVGQIRPVISV